MALVVHYVHFEPRPLVMGLTLNRFCALENVHTPAVILFKVWFYSENWLGKNGIFLLGGDKTLNRLALTWKWVTALGRRLDVKLPFRDLCTLSDFWKSSGSNYQKHSAPCSFPGEQCKSSLLQWHCTNTGRSQLLGILENLAPILYTKQCYFYYYCYLKWTIMQCLLLILIRRYEWSDYDLNHVTYCEVTHILY